MQASKWGVAPTGDGRAREDWREQLKSGHDPWVELHNDTLVLRSLELDNLTTPELVLKRGEALIQEINGVMAVLGLLPMTGADTVVEFTEGGEIRRHIYVMVMETAEARDRANFVVEGATSVDTPQASQVQRWMAKAANDSDLRDALRYFGTSQDWSDIFKTLECLEAKFETWAQLLALNWAPKKQVKLLKQTANYSRHASSKNVPPKDPMSLTDARDLMTRLLVRAFS